MERIGNVDYKIDLNGKIKTFHANMPKLYDERVEDDDVADGEILRDSPRAARSDGPTDVTVNPEQTGIQCNNIYALLE